MKNRIGETKRKRRQHVATACIGILSIMAGMAGSPAAQAAQVATGRDDLTVRWDNTFKYSASWRLKDPSPALLSGINADDGDRNFDPGFISNRVDILSELDVVYKNTGMRISAAGWYDALYNRPNNNDSPATANAFSVPNNKFTRETRKLHGRKAEILDAFVFSNTNIQNIPVSFRAGRHTLLWGESLLLATNGISYAQAPLDLIKALSVPGTQAKELFIPVGQLSANAQYTAKLSFAGYYQFEWRRSRLPASGSYFSTADMLDVGGESLLLARRPGAALLRGADLKGSDHGQWGLSARYRADKLDTDFGLYYIRFNEKQPQLYTRPGAGDYFLVYPDDIKLFGASFSTVMGAANVAGEMHVRRNTPLASKPLSVQAGVPADNDDHPLYAVGNTVHAQVSVTYPVPTTPLWEAGTVSAEVGVVRRTSITRNAANADPTRDASAWGWTINFTPSYFQVLPNLDLNVPISFSYNPKGRSPASAFSGHRTGNISIGLSGEFQRIFTMNLRYTTYVGPETNQRLSDRDFVSLSVQRTF